MPLTIVLIGPPQTKSYQYDYDVIIDDIDEDDAVDPKRRRGAVPGVQTSDDHFEEFIRIWYFLFTFLVCLIWVLYRVTCWLFVVTKLWLSLVYPDDFVQL